MTDWADLAARRITDEQDGIPQFQRSAAAIIREEWGKIETHNVVLDRAMQDCIRELEAERDAAIKALERYGSHDDDCDYITTPVFDGRKDQVECSCGFRAARLQQKETTSFIASMMLAKEVQRLEAERDAAIEVACDFARPIVTTGQLQTRGCSGIRGFVRGLIAARLQQKDGE